MTQAAAPPRRGRFITLEGGEGAGKSTQAARIVAALKARYPVEPDAGMEV